MTDIVKNISQLVENQFPQVYKEEGKELIAFIEAYYEFLETTKQSTKLSREMFDANDIDKTLDDFIIHFKEKYLKDFPFISATDKRFLVKNVMDLYSNKGSESSIKLLMRMLFGEEVDVYYPGQDIFKPSDSTWFLPKYIELSESNRTKSFVNKQIIGAISGAKAFVESIVTKRIDGRIIDVLYLSSIQGQFIFGEFITDDGDLSNAPAITGSMTDITISNGGQGNKVGDVLNVESQGGRQGQVRVTAISNETGRVNFELQDGGDGYTLNGQQAVDEGHENFLSTSTSVYVSDRVLTYKNKKYTRQEIYNELLHLEEIYNNNSAAISTLEDSTQKPFEVSLSEWFGGFSPSSEDAKDIFEFLTEAYWNSTDSQYYIRYDFDKAGTNHSPAEPEHLEGVLDGTYDNILKSYLIDYSFINFEKVVQPKETISLFSADDIKNQIKVGDYIYGYDGGVYNPVDGDQLAKGVVVKFEDNANDNTQFDITVQPEEGTFTQQTLLVLGASDFDVDNEGEILEEEGEATLSFEYLNGATPFSEGDTIYQYVVEYEPQSASSIENGTTYTIMSSGNTNFVAVGASDNSVGTSFTALTTFDAAGIGAGTGTVRSAETPYYVSSYGEARIAVGGINGTSLTLDRVYGTFEDSTSNEYTIQSSFGVDVAWSRDFNITDLGARARISTINKFPTYSEVYLDPIYGQWNATKEVRGNSSQFKALISSVSEGQGASDIYLNNIETANGILDTVANTTAIGYVTGQNSTSVGIHSVSGDFLGSDVQYTFDPWVIAVNLLRYIVGLETPRNSSEQVLFEEITRLATEEGENWTLSDCLDVIKYAVFGRLPGSSQVINLLGYFSTEKFFVKTVREELISPPRDANGTIINIDRLFVENVSEGEGASFQPGSLENEEDIFLYTDLIGANNVNDIAFVDVELNGANSGIGFVDSIDVISYELKGYDGTTANRKLYVVDVAEDVTTLYSNGDGLTLTRLDGSQVTGSIEVINAVWTNYDTTDDVTSTLNKIVIAMDASIASPLPCETFTGPGPDNNVTGIIKTVPIDRLIQPNTIIVQGDYSSVAPADATLDTTDLGSDIYGTIVKWVHDNTNSRVYLKMDGTSFNSANTFTTTGDFYAKVNIDLDEVAYIRLGVLDVVDTRVPLTQSQTIELEGGGLAGGDPLLAASALLSYDGGIGYVHDTTVADPGSNYYSTPTIPTSYAWTIDTWTGVQAGKPLLNVNVDFGYGFGLRPHGDDKTPLDDILKSGTFTIGSITSLTNINPGSLYNADPFINVYNPYIAAYKRANYIFRIELLSGNPFQVGETVYQTVANVQSAKGIVLEARSDELVIDRTSFYMNITDGVELVGGTSQARANVTDILPASSSYWGTNAVVTGDVVVATGVATDVEVISSGFGYNQDESITMISADGSNDFVITGKSKLVNQGTGRGFWRTFDSHLNYDKKIRDNDFYQEFSYQVLSGQSLNRYEQILKDTLHVAGTKMFGGVVYESAVSAVAETEAVVDQVALIEFQLVDENELVIGADDVQPLLVTKEVIRDV